MLFQFIDIVFQVYLVMLFARILGSWVPELQQYRFMAFISYYTDPYLNFFRSFIPPLGMIDLSPIVAIFALSFGRSLLQSLLVMILR